MMSNFDLTSLILLFSYNYFVFLGLFPFFLLFLQVSRLWEVATINKVLHPTRVNVTKGCGTELIAGGGTNCIDG